jgi:superfamily II DNA or RNA helicase
MLRNYQTKTVDATRESIRNGKKRPVVVSMTASGKSHIYGDIIKRVHENNKRSLFLVHRRNLVFQFQEKLKEFFDIDSGIIMSGIKSETEKPVQLATVQTLSRRIDLDDPESNRFIVDADVVLIDEAHHAVSPSYQKILFHYTDKIIIGTTATPCRLDNRPLGDIFNHIVEVIKPKELIDQGYISPVRYFAPTDIDVSGLKMSSGDYNRKQLAERADKPKISGNVVQNWLKYGEDRNTLVFGVNVRHSLHLMDEFLKAGIPAEHLDAHSSDEERDDVFRRLENGDTRVVCNVALYTEGMDVPSISCVCLVRPTKSFGLYRQMVGRGLRIEDGKKDCLLFDHSGNIERHGFIDDPITWTLSGKRKAWIVPERDKDEKLPNPVKCRVCGQIFIDRKECPICGTELKPFGKQIDHRDVELKELKKKNRDYTWEQKIDVMMALRWHAEQKGYLDGWVAHAYKSFFGVWPNDGRVKYAPPMEPSGEAKNILKHILIKKAYQYKKRKEMANG